MEGKRREAAGDDQGGEAAEPEAQQQAGQGRGPEGLVGALDAGEQCEQHRQNDQHEGQDGAWGGRGEHHLAWALLRRL